MMNLGRILACSLFALLLAQPAAAQKLPKLAKPSVPTLKPGVLPPPGGGGIRRNRKEMAKLANLAKKDRAKKDRKARKKRSRKAIAAGRKRGGDPIKARRKPPGAKASANSEKVPAWRQQEEKDSKPTLSADFIKNCARLRPGVKVHLDIYDEELDAVVKMIACMTGKNIILAKPLKGKKITIYSPTLVTAQEAYRAFLTALAANALTIVQKGKFIQILDIASYPGAGGIETRDRMPAAEDRMTTQIVRLKHVDAQEIQEVLSKFASTHAKFVVYGPTNSLIITELALNLRKLIKLIKELDLPGGSDQLWTYQVLYAEASELATKIQEIFDTQNQGKSGPKKKTRKRKKRGKNTQPTTASVGQSDLDATVTKVMADERTNRLLIVATARSYRKIKSLIAKLDVEVPGDGQVHIHQLSHAKATDLASVLSSLSQEQKGRGSSSSKRRKSKKKKKSKTSAGSAALFEGEVSVTADEDTNSLVITASLKDYLSLKTVIEQLDRPRRQVFIEAIIMEVSISNKRAFGISMHGVPDFPIGGENIPIPLTAQNVPGVSTLNLASAATLTGFAAAGGSSDTVDFGGAPIPKFGVILRAIATSNDVNILSTPHILTTDNEEAEITVGSNVPFPSGFVGGLGGAGGGRNGGFGSSFLPTVNVQRQDVALTLKITPRINAGGFVTLEVDQVIEEIDSVDERYGPTTSKRSIKSTVIVKDQNTVVIGGLQRDRQLNNNSAVPLLGEIPVIGYFFRDNSKDRERRNLLLMLTPYVIESPEDFKAIYKRKMEEHREFAARFQTDGQEIKLGLDYGKKHGALESINQSLRAAHAEEALLEEIRRSEQGPPLPQELDGIPIDNPFAPAKKPPAPEAAPVIGPIQPHHTEDLP